MLVWWMRLLSGLVVFVTCPGLYKLEGIGRGKTHQENTCSLFFILRIGGSRSRGVRRTREASQSTQCVCTHVVCADNMDTLYIPRQ